MIRQLLAILALVTGLAAVAEPVQAARTSVVAVSAAEQAVPCRRAPIVLQLGSETRRTREPQVRGCRQIPRAVTVPAVQLQADRARE